MHGGPYRLAIGLALLGIIAAGCSIGSGSGSGDTPPAPTVAGDAGNVHASAYDAAESQPREDTLYSDVGDPGVDALHYGLDLRWNPQGELLTATETLLFRAATSADHVQLDLARQLQVGHVWLDGKAVVFRHPGKDLVVSSPVRAGSRHVLQLTYSGTPEPVVAPTDRPDFSTTGWTIAPDGTVWTMQEPFGAYSWYAVNDQPSDKAYYDVTIHAPKGQVGVSNGELRSRTSSATGTVTQWRLPEPAAAYLVTIAIGRYTETKDTGPHGLPISYWTPTDRPSLVAGLRYTPQAVGYLETKVGRYPFPTLGVLLVPSQSAMETQSMVTLGIGDYTLSRDVLVHEIAHQWYGDTVTPDDWSDLWMNEGMATYLAEGNWTAAHSAQSLTGILRRWSRSAAQMRSEYGAPAAYHPGSFGEGNVYYIPALMWDTLRQRLGDEQFWSLATRWLHRHRFTSQDRDSLAAWWSRASGQDLTSFFHTWLLGPREPAWHAG
jgi:aminopeptidase N